MSGYDNIYEDMKKDRRKAENFILNFESEKKQYEATKTEYLANQKKENEGAGRKSLPSSPTEAEAVISAQYDADSENYSWLKAVELALKTFGERKYIFLEVRREAEKHCHGGRGRKGWVIYTQQHYSDKIQQRFINDTGWLGERTVKSWWQQIISCVVEFHLRLLAK